MELIDVRTPAEFRKLHVEFTRNVPLDRLDPMAMVADCINHADQPLYVICRSGSRGKQACEKLHSAGLVHVMNVEGVTFACETCGLPMVRGKKVISLERRVRIATGFVVLVSAVLAIHPYFAGLSALVGAGLMFVGITDNCGMAMILARMPCNQVSDKPHASETAGRMAAFLAAIVVLTPTATFAVDHTKDSLATIQRGMAEQKAV